MNKKMEKIQELKISNLLIAGSVNSEYETFDWFGERLVAYGCHNLVFLYDVERVKVLAALKGHSGRINCVRWLDDGSLFSACSKGELKVWLNPVVSQKSNLEDFLDKEENWGRWTIGAEIGLKKRNIIQFSTIRVARDEIALCMLTTKSDLHYARIKKTEGNEDNEGDSGLEIVVEECLDFGTNLLECSTMIKFKGRVYLALSSSDFAIHLYKLAKTQQSDGEGGQHYLEYLNSLQGHEDKVSSLDAINTIKEIREEGENGEGAQGEEGMALLASGSKDNYIKIWRFVEELDESVTLSAMKRNIYRIGDHFIYLESSLLGHVDSVSSVNWAFDYSKVPVEGEDDDDVGNEDGKEDPEEAGKNLILVSSSLDFSIQIWEREEKSKVRAHRMISGSFSCFLLD